VVIGGNDLSVPSHTHRHRSCATDADGADAWQRDKPDRRKAGCPPFMTIYISSSSDSGTRIVRIEGWLEGEAVAELERVIDAGSGALRLDLSELRSADKVGLAALRAHRAAGASIVRASPYIKLLLGT
jgi:hypothetical protein